MECRIRNAIELQQMKMTSRLNEQPRSERMKTCQKGKLSWHLDLLKLAPQVLPKIIDSLEHLSKPEAVVFPEKLLFALLWWLVQRKR